MCMPSMPDIPEPEPVVTPPPAPPMQQQEAIAPPPETATPKEGAPKLKSNTTARKTQQQKSRGMSSLTIPLNTGSGAAKKGGGSGLNIPT